PRPARSGSGGRPDGDHALRDPGARRLARGGARALGAALDPAYRTAGADAAMTGTRQEGFTLLELLISVSLLVLLMAMLFAGLDIGTRHIGRQSARLDRASRMVVAQSFLRLQLADARAVTASSLPGDAITFDGRLDGVDFLSAAPQSIAQGGLQVLSVGVVDPHGAGGEQLLVGWRPLTASDADTSSGSATESEQRAALLDHIQEAAFA